MRIDFAVWQCRPARSILRIRNQSDRFLPWIFFRHIPAARHWPRYVQWTAPGGLHNIYFPRFDQEILRPVENKTSRIIQTGTETILLVEDEELVRTLTRQILAKVLHRPTVRLKEAASDGHERDVMRTMRYLLGIDEGEERTR